jgi:hypothetical protein
MTGYLGNVHSNATLLEGFSIKALEKYSLKLCNFRRSWIRGPKRVKKVKHAGRMSKTRDDDWKCKTLSYVWSCKKPAGFSMIPSLQWLLKKPVMCCNFV